MLLIQKVYFLKLTQLFRVLKEFLSIHHIFVDIVKIGENTFSPPIEMIQRNAISRGFRIVLLHTTDGVDGIVYLQFPQTIKELIDGDIGRCPERL